MTKAAQGHDPHWGKTSQRTARLCIALWLAIAFSLLTSAANGEEGWQPAGATTIPYGFHDAVLLADGDVLVVGYAEPLPGADGGIAAAELYSPATGLFTPAAPPPLTWYPHALMALSDDRALLMSQIGRAHV